VPEVLEDEPTQVHRSDDQEYKPGRRKTQGGNVLEVFDYGVWAQGRRSRRFTIVKLDEPWSLPRND